MITIEIERPIPPAASKQIAIQTLNRLQARFAGSRLSFDGVNPAQGSVSVGKTIKVQLYQTGDSILNDPLKRVASVLDENTVRQYAETNL